MRKNLPNVILKDLLTQDQINTVFDIVNKTTSQDFHNELSFNSWHIVLPQDIVNIFTSKAESVAGEKLILKEYNFSRYEKITSSCGKHTFNPLLFPHTDEAFGGPRFTLDYQIRSNVDWDIIVDNWEEEQTFLMKDNEALTFSGTHQVHWRPKREFVEGEFLEAIFIHFEPATPSVLSTDHINAMRQKGLEKFKAWKETPGITSNVNHEHQEHRYREKN